MELTTEQKAAVFDWLCKQTMVSIRSPYDEYRCFEYFIGDVAEEKTRVPTEQALYNAFLKDMGNA